eukprot:Skav209307  [mRNA]  locus=scaffold994:313722:314274:+ [translate_table: standard]
MPHHEPGPAIGTGPPTVAYEPGPTIGAAPPSLAGALMDDEVVDDNEVPEEYDEQVPADPEEVHEALRGGHAFKRLPVEVPGDRKHHADDGGMMEG